ncbi:hypothetical protein G4B88_030334 [Cannabis sativa]|uniref:DUF6469 domain-containing protein n=1 Tax=Cannabis sativa TaxID=3483 RepID=A0A7J6EBP7_CANSA|nr:hypothetical protein G4B88_030334 [Cannabis sativa]
MILVNAKPETGRLWAFISVTEDEKGNDSNSNCTTNFKAKSSKKFELDMQMKTSLFVVFLGNLTTNKRALHMSCNLDICNMNESQTSAVLACLVFT